MAQIPRAALDYLTDEINCLSKDAQAKLLRVLEKLDWNDVSACREAVCDALNSVLDAYGAAAAQAAADFFDVSREIATGAPLGAIPEAGREIEATNGAVRAFVDKVNKGDIDGFNRLVLSRIDYELKRAAGYTMTQNAARDPLRPKFARVPSGGETCRFCLMLASRGFVYHSKRSAGDVDHYHNDCDCRVVCQWNGGGVEGYDPDEIAERWNNLEWQDAEARAERNGTDPDEEYAKRMSQLNESAKRAKKRNKVLEKQVDVGRAQSRSFESVGATRATGRRSANVKLKKSQFGKKARKHAAEWGLDPSSPSDRAAFEQVISVIIDEAEDVDTGDWRGQPGPCTFFRKGNDLVIVNADDEFVTIMKGGGSNKRYLNAIGR